MHLSNTGSIFIFSNALEEREKEVRELKEALRKNETILGKNLSECQRKELEYDSLKFKADKYYDKYHKRAMTIKENKQLILKYSKWLKEEKHHKEQLISIIDRHPRVSLNHLTVTPVVAKNLSTVSTQGVANEISTVSTPLTYCQNTKKG